MPAAWTDTAVRAAELFEKMRRKLRGRVRANEPMANHTTWRVGGPASLFIEPADRDDLLCCLELLQEADVPWVPVGAGSNLLVRDGGIPEAVLNLRTFRQLCFGSNNDVIVGAGMPLMTLIGESAKRGLGGIEELTGIPGTVGGAVFMNAGAGGQEMASVVTSVHLLTEFGEQIRQRKELEFSYRHSALQEGDIVLEARLQLSEAPRDRLEQTLREKLALRRSRQGVGRPNAGSTFKNPPGSQAWRLIEEAGLRGRCIGGAAVSEVHANFIVNCGGATATDILTLIDVIRTEVAEHSGVVLEPEIRILGVDSGVPQERD